MDDEIGELDELAILLSLRCDGYSRGAKGALADIIALANDIKSTADKLAERERSDSNATPPHAHADGRS